MRLPAGQSAVFSSAKGCPPMASSALIPNVRCSPPEAESKGAAGSDTPIEPAATATELSFKSENFAFEFDNARRPGVGG